ncbi:acetyltransferase (GNAT) family protein [Microbacteriaceae bacterium MWH-Ta3]|nr:acetyltransferase (GNAT) family protein [Microbacteriaceae bacterium MWH-Ta3]
MYFRQIGPAMNIRYRPFHHADTDAVLALWDEVRAAGHEPVYSLAEVLGSCEKDHAVVAYDDSGITGIAVGRAAHEQGWIVFFAVFARCQSQGIGRTLLANLEESMAKGGLTKVSVLVNDSQSQTGVLEKSGFAHRRHLNYFEREIPISDKERAILNDVGGRLLPRDLWDRIAGMGDEKQVLERRLVLPLSDAGLAEQFGVRPPQAIMLFGPPGTGKTTFAKAVASRLNWPFVEIFASRLAGEPGGIANGLRETFNRVAELDNVVVFIDEVEEIAARRAGDPPSPTQGVTNELLKLIPAFREKPGRLLMCATNFVTALDPAFLRHGRFDYVVPIGLPDSAARWAIWQRYIPPSAAAQIDISALVDRTDGFTPADIEFAARKASQRALESAVYGGATDVNGPTTADYVWAIGETRSTVSAEVLAQFESEISAMART